MNRDLCWLLATFITPKVNRLRDGFINTDKNKPFLSKNPEAIEIILADLKYNRGKNINWYYLSGNPEAIDLIKDDIWNNEVKYFWARLWTSPVIFILDIMRYKAYINNIIKILEQN